MDKFNKFNEILKVLFQIKKPSEWLGSVIYKIASLTQVNLPSKSSSKSSFSILAPSDFATEGSG